MPLEDGWDLLARTEILWPTELNWGIRKIPTLLKHKIFNRIHKEKKILREVYISKRTNVVL